MVTPIFIKQPVSICLKLNLHLLFQGGRHVAALLNHFVLFCFASNTLSQSNLNFNPSFIKQPVTICLKFTLHSLFWGGRHVAALLSRFVLCSSVSNLGIPRKTNFWKLQRPNTLSVQNGSPKHMSLENYSVIDPLS